jgi:hypothetical protein
MMIGGLFAKLSLNTASFEQGVKRARQTMFRMAQDMKVAAVGAAAAGAALGTMGAAAVQSAREIERLSQMAGAAPRDLQRWSAASRKVGIDQEKLADILKDVNDRVGDFAATGGGPMKDFFENIGPKVGVTADMFKDLSGPDALQLYVSSLEKAGLNQQQMTFYMEAMASDATLLIPLLRNGGIEMERLGDAAEAAGLVMSQEMIGNLTAAGAAVDGVRNTFVGMRNELMAEMAPAFTRLAEVIRDAMKEGGAIRVVFDAIASNAGRISSYVIGAAAAFGVYASAVAIATAATMGFKRLLIRTGIGALVVGIGEAVYQFTRLSSAVGSVGGAFSILVDLAKGAMNAVVAGAVTGINRYIGIYRGAFEAIKAIWAALPRAMGSVAYAAANATIAGIEYMLNSVTRKANAVIKSVNYAIALLPEKFGGSSQIGLLDGLDLGRIENPYAGGAADAGRSAAEAFRKGFNADTFDAPKIFDVPTLSEQVAKIGSIIRGAEARTKAANTAAADLNTTLASLGDTNDGGAAGGAKEASDAIKALEEQIRTTKSNVGQMRDAFAGAFSSIVTKSATAGEAVSNLLSRFADMLANKAFQGLWNGTLGSGVNAGGGSNWLGQIGNAIFGSLPGFATGTPFAPGGLAMVGERGPELVNLPRGSRVFDAQRTQGLVDGGSGGQLAIALADGLKAEWLGEAGNQSVQITQGGIEQYDRQMPGRLNQIASDPRTRG